LGTMIEGLSGAVIATIAIFLPSFFLIIAALPFLSELRQKTSFQGVLVGVNASVVGVLLEVFYYHDIKSLINMYLGFVLADLYFLISLLNVLLIVLLSSL